MLTTLFDDFNHHKNKLQDCKIYLACSGGQDSLSLAYGCYLLHKRGQIDSLPTLLHVHHGWQRANDDWAKLVSNWSKALGFDCQILPIELNKNSETKARQARYDALFGAMKSGDVLMLGHHQDDQAETILMRLANGAGVLGLSGMRKWQSFGDKKVNLWRPLLTVSRATINRFACEHKLPYVNDSTNFDDLYARGKLRNHIVPSLCQLNPKAVQNIARTAQLLAQADEVIDELIDDKIQQVVGDFNQIPYYQTLNINELTAISISLQSFIIHRWLSTNEPMPPPKRFSDDVMDLAYKTSTDHQTRLFWQGVFGYVICRYRALLYRYDERAWSCLMADDAHIKDADNQIILKSVGDTSIVWQKPKILMTITVEAVSGQTKVCICHKSLYGKKLMQTLGIPVWLRKNLWLVSFDKRPALLITIGLAWRLDSINQDVQSIGAYFA